MRAARDISNSDTDTRHPILRTSRTSYHVSAETRGRFTIPNNVHCGPSNPAKAEGETDMTGAEMKAIRHGLSEAIGRRLSLADMAKLCGLAPKNGADTMRKWEEGDGPSGPVAALLSLYASALDSDWDAVSFMLKTIRERLDA